MFSLNLETLYHKCRQMGATKASRDDIYMLCTSFHLTYLLLFFKKKKRNGLPPTHFTTHQEVSSESLKNMHMTQSSLDSRGSDQRSYLPQGHTAIKQSQAQTQRETLWGPRFGQQRAGAAPDAPSTHSPLPCADSL